MVYTYFGYPLLLILAGSAVQLGRDIHFLFRRNTRRAQGHDEDLLKVSVIIPAHNEDAAIAAKIANCLALDYPRELLHVIVGSDGSDDRTNEIVRTYADRGIELADYPDRRGKPSVLNDTVLRATGDILIFSDATTMIDPDAIRKIVRHFANSNVAVVNGELRFSAPTTEHRGEGLYWRYEIILKFLENRLGVVLGSSGALCAVRRSAFRQIPADCICDDLVITLNAVIDGYRAVYDPEAQSAEETAGSVQQESSRRERIGAGNFQALTYTWPLLNPFRGWVSLCYLSHKIFKWITWVFMVGAFVANACLVDHQPYTTLFILQLAFYASAVFRLANVRIPIISKISGITYYFIAMHIALFRGLVRYVRRTQKVAWQRAHR